MRDITEELSKATEVPYQLWEFEDLMKKTGDFKHKSTEEIENGCKKICRKRTNKIKKKFK